MKKLVTIILVIIMVFAPCISAFAGNDKKVETVNDFAFDVNNANFHCNDIEGGGNGRVWPNLEAFGVTDGKGNGNGNNKNKTVEQFEVVRVDGTKWRLTQPVICPECGSTDWVTFSNNSGAPNGNNVQFQHTAPTKRWITVTVIYYLDIPECEFVCVNADSKCGFECTCPEDCVFADRDDHDPDNCWKCGEGHDCPLVGLTCGTVCDHKINKSKVIVNEKKLIVIADGFDFEHVAPDEWEGGEYKQGPKNIDKTIYSSETFKIYYAGEGNCECSCEKVECNAACEPCGYVDDDDDDDVIIVHFLHRDGVEILHTQKVKAGDTINWQDAFFMSIWDGEYDLEKGINGGPGFNATWGFDFPNEIHTGNWWLFDYVNKTYGELFSKIGEWNDPETAAKVSKTIYLIPEYKTFDVETKNVNVVFQGNIQGNGFGWWGKIIGFDKELNIEIEIDWDAVYDAYAKTNLYSEWDFDEALVEGWITSNGGVGNQLYFAGARPEKLILNEGMFLWLSAERTPLINLRPVLATRPVDPDPIVNLGFIGYYVNDGKVMSTSIHWQYLEKEGDMIDWDAVDAAYADWIAQGGLAPNRVNGWLSSGFASFNFEDYAALGYGDFTIKQIEGYYNAYYVDPGYILPSDPIVIDLGFIGYYVNNGKVLSTSFYWQKLQEGDMIDWDAVDAAYAGWVAQGGLEPKRDQWKTSGPATFTFDDYAKIGHGDFSLGQMETFYLAFFVSPGYVEPDSGDPGNGDPGNGDPGNGDPGNGDPGNGNQNGQGDNNNQGGNGQGGNGQGGNGQGGNGQGGNNNSQGGGDDSQGGGSCGGGNQDDDDQGEDNNDQGDGGDEGGGCGGGDTGDDDDDQGEDNNDQGEDE